MKKILMVLIIVMILFLNLGISFAYPQSFEGTNYYPSNMNELGYNDLIIFAKYYSFADAYWFYEVWIDTESTQVRVYEGTSYKKISFNDEYRIDVKFMDLSKVDGIYEGNWIQAMRGGGYSGDEFILDYKTSDGYEIVYSTMDLCNEDGDLIYIASSDLELNIVLPLDGFMDNSIYYNVFLYTKIPGEMNPGDITYNVKVNDLYVSEQGLYNEVMRNVVYESGDGLANEVQFVVELPVGENIISVEMMYGDELMESDNVTVTRLSGFVDEDGDGLDDRTGQTDNSERPVYDPETEMPQKPEDGDLLAWMEYVGELLAYVFEMVMGAIRDFATSVFDGIKAVLEMAQPMFAFVEQFFSSLPAPMSAAVIALVSVAMALAILKIIRG